MISTTCTQQPYYEAPITRKYILKIASRHLQTMQSNHPTNLAFIQERLSLQRWCHYHTILNESAKSRAWRACVFACFCAWRACVVTCLAYLRGYVLTCLRGYVLTCLHAWRAWRAYVFGVLAYLVCLRACVLVTMKCFIFLPVCMLGVLFCLNCFIFQYLHLKILTAKNLCALLSWTYFLFTFW